MRKWTEQNEQDALDEFLQEPRPGFSKGQAVWVGMAVANWDAEFWDTSYDTFLLLFHHRSVGFMAWVSRFAQQPATGASVAMFPRSLLAPALSLSQKTCSREQGLQVNPMDLSTPGSVQTLVGH